MKSCFGMLAASLGLLVVFGGGALLWYLSDTAEFERRDGGPVDAAPPQAVPADDAPGADR